MLAAFSITPIGVGEDVGEQVAVAVRVIRESGLPNRTSASFTEIEGEWDEVFAVIKKATDAVMAAAGRCSISIKADVRPGHDSMLTTKLESVERHLTQ
ncbi:MTH1187 family thiamine-binding protein [Nocardia crassostreae]|uniref:MTH1187 family thiamine-binding protein n=1 Tax=Nocardia crassostreae TaxID=53428 RepID=UPI00082F6DC9|nr:MTH1187 family thiamine-binding protein [Nocardia crassostreae]